MHHFEPQNSDIGSVNYRLPVVKSVIFFIKKIIGVRYDLCFRMSAEEAETDDATETVQKPERPAMRQAGTNTFCPYMGDIIRFKNE
jgi:hypothetical protein